MLIKTTQPLLLLYTLFYTIIISSQIQWQNTIGGTDYELLASIELASDGNYILGGYSKSDISGDKTENSRGNADYWITKIDDTTGAILWQKTIGGSLFDHATVTKETSDGGYILGGYSLSSISGEKTENSRGQDDYWLVKLDANRNIIWDKTYGGLGVDRLWTLVETADGGFLIGGVSNSDISGEKSENSRGLSDMWLIKIDANGTMQWDKTYGGSDEENLESIVIANDGGYILTGWSLSNISGEKTENSRGLGDFWIIKIDISGNIIWQKTIGGDNGDYASKIQTTQDGYIIGGWSASSVSGEKTENKICNSVDLWLVKIDNDGQIIWDKTIGGDSSEWMGSLKKTDDEGFIIGAMSYSGISAYKTEANIGDRDYWLVKIDKFGNVVWDKTIGGTDMDQLTSLVKANDGDYVFGGWSLSDISGDKNENTNGLWDYWLVKLKMNSDNYNPPTYTSITICEGEDLSLSAPSGTSYQWSGPNGFSSTEQNPIITTANQDNSGIYNVTVNDGSACQTIAITKSTILATPVINQVNDIYSCDDNFDGFSEDFDTSGIETTVLGGQTGMNVSYFDSNGNTLPNPLPNPFTNTVANEETITVQVINTANPTCYAETTFKLIAQPCIDLNYNPFFTPNNDNFNDIWPNLDNATSVVIYNRFGKIIKVLSQNETGWDGTYNGTEQPSGDYWFKATIFTDIIVRGHFALIR